MTKVEAIVRVMQGNGGTETLQEIYAKIGRYYKGAKASKEWSAGIRGVLYRELRNGRTFQTIGPATFALLSGGCMYDHDHAKGVCEFHD
jgi:hypothetical protein